MSCPRWPLLLAEREGRGDDPPGWREAVAHLEACPACRREAFRLDPLLAFSRLPAPAPSEGEVEAMKVAVAALRRASRVPAESERAARLPAYSTARGWGRALAAAALVALGLAIAPGEPGGGRGPAAPAAEVEAYPVFALGSFVEDLDLSDARIYQVDSQEMQVVMIVHPSLDL